MSEVFLGQIMMSGYGFTTKGFAACNGQTLPILQNQALYSLLGTTYGGDGKTTFMLPDLRARTPVGAGPSADAGWQPAAMPIGLAAGNETVTLSSDHLPPHSHQFQGATRAAGNVRSPAGATLATTPASLYGSATDPNPVPLNPLTCSGSGGSQPHPNMQPYLAINFCIALTGSFPSPS